MAKRRRSANLGGLAALAALGYMLTKGERNYAPVEDRSTGSSGNKPSEPRLQETFMGLDDTGAAGSAAGPAAGNRIDEDIRRFADVGTNFNEQGQPYSLIARPPAGPAGPATAGSAGPARPNYNAIAARQDAELRARQAAARPPINDRDHFFSGPMASNTYDPGLAGLSSAAVGQGEAEAVRRATPPPLRDELTRTTLGTPIGPAPGAPSIYAGPEAFRAYRAQQAQQRDAQPATPQGSARNIVQQMREKDKAVLAAVRRRQEEEEAARELARQVAEARAAERKRESARMTERGRQTNPYYGRTAEERRQSMRAEGGAIKAKAKPKKMASGGMTSASKRGDGIASKGKTKCKMY